MGILSNDNGFMGGWFHRTHLARHTNPFNIDLSGFTYTHVRVDNMHGNPFSEWTALGRPDSIPTGQYKMMAANQEPVILEKSKAQNQIRLIMPPSSISMVILSNGKGIPESPEIIAVHQYLGYNGEKTEFVRWRQIQKQIVSYDVFASYDGGDFIKVTPQPLFDCGFLNILPKDVRKVEYKVVAGKL